MNSHSSPDQDRRSAMEPLEPRLLLSGTLIQSVDIVELDGVATTDYPMTLSLIFKEGDVASNVHANIGGQDLVTQTDVKVRWADNSVKHALVSFAIPSLPASGTVTVDIEDGGTNYNSDWVSKAELLDTQNYDFEAELSVSDLRLHDIDPRTAADISARTMLNGISVPEYWIQGEVCTEFLIRDFDVNIQSQIDTTYHDQLNVQFYIRTYAGWDGYRVDTVVENAWANARGNVWYDFDLNLGYASPQTVMSYNDFKHNQLARWREYHWVGDEPSEIDIKYDVAYMIETGLLPNYDLNYNLPATGPGSIEGLYNWWLSKPTDIMGTGTIVTSMSSTGMREDIALNPGWAVKWFISDWDTRMKYVTLNHGDLSGSTPVHYREYDPSRANYQGILNIDTRPDIWSGWWDYQYNDPQDRIPAPIGDTDTGWLIDTSHQPSLCYVPYLYTGDFYYQEEMQFWSEYNLANCNPDYRSQSTGIVHGSVRGQAWWMRNMVDAANLADDAIFGPRSDVIDTKIAANITRWNNVYLGGTYGAVHNWGFDGATWQYPAGNLDPDITKLTASFMEDFMMFTLGHMDEVGWDVQAVIDWFGHTVVNRYANPDFNPNHGNDTRLPIARDVGGQDYYFQTWAEVNAGYWDPEEWTSTLMRNDYLPEAYAAASFATHLPSGDQAWEWIRQRFSGNPDYTGFIILPRDGTAQDTTAPSTISNLAVAGGTADESVNLTWTAPGDDGTTGAAWQYDIRYSTSPIDAGNWDSATRAIPSWPPGNPWPQAYGTGESWTVTGLPADTTLYFAIKGVDNVGNSGVLSNVVSATTLDDTVAPAAVSDLATTGNDDYEVTLEWTAPGDDGSSGTATSYDIRYSTSVIDDANFASATPAAGIPIPAVAGTVQNMTVTGLSHNTTYYFAMKATDNKGNVAALSNVLQASTANDTTAPAAISDLAASNPGEDTVDLTWTAPGDDGSSGTAASYEIRHHTSAIAAGNWASATPVVAGVPTPSSAGSAESATVSGLPSGQTVYFAIKTTDNIGNVSGVSNSPSETTILDQTAPDAITDLTIDTLMSTAVDISWTAPGDDGSTGTATSYDVRYSTSPIDAGNWDSATQAGGEPTPAAAGTGQSMTVTGLSGSTTYYFAIKTTDNAANVSGLSNVPSGTTAVMSVVQFSSPSSTNPESFVSVDLPVELDVFSLQTITVDYAVTGGTATGGGADYTLANGQLTFTSGQTIQYIPLTVYNDQAVEPDETIIITLSNPVNADLGANTTHTYTIVDNDVAGQTQIDFEQAGDEGNFAALYESPVITRVSGHGGNVMQLSLNNKSSSVKFSPGASDFLLSEGAVSADVRLQYYNSTGISTGLLVKDWTDDGQGQSGGYVVFLKPDNGTIRIWIGAHKDPSGNTENYKFYRGGATNHTDFFTGTVTTYTPIMDSTKRDLDWWNIEADMIIVNGTDVQIDVTVTGPDLTEYNFSWTDSMSAAVVGDGRPGLVLNDTWNIHGQYDNFTILQDVGNSAPTVDAGTDASVWLPNAANLDATVNDDGQPDPPASVTTLWTKDSGPGTVTFGDDSQVDTTATFSVAGVYVLKLEADDGEFVTSDTVTITVNPVTTVALTANDASADETGPDAGQFTVTRDNTSGDLTVYYNVSGSAAAGDYSETLGGSAIIADGNSSAVINVTPVDDSEIENAETVTLTLAADASYIVGAPSSDTVTIVDNDVPTVTIAASDANASETGPDAGTFTITRSGSGLVTDGDLTVNYTVGGTASAGDYSETLTGSVTILDGNSSATIDITPIDDANVEGAETVTLTLSADAAYTLGGSTSDTVTIADNDTASGVITGELKTWHNVTVTFDGPMTSESDTPNPFTDYRLVVTFTGPSDQTYDVPGHYAADGNAAETSATSGDKWRVHFVPDEVGTWSYTASFRTGTNVALDTAPGAGSSAGYFDGASDSFSVTATDKTGDDFRGKGMLRYVGEHQLQFAETGEYFLKGGANSPENFLAYYEFDGTYDTGGTSTPGLNNGLHEYAPHVSDWNTGDPTWQSGEGKGIIGAVNYLASQGVNSIYFLTYNVDGGDGRDVWTWTSDTERARFDTSKLDQWEILFDHMDAKGVQLHVVLHETENDEILGGSSSLNNVRKLYFRELVARFGHHLAVQWNIGEENDNTDAQRISFAQYIRDWDPYDHPIVVHTDYGQASTWYDGLTGNSNFEGTSIQGDAASYNSWANELRGDSASAGRKWAIYGDEQGPEVHSNMDNVDELRKDGLWGNLMGGGAGVEWYFAYQETFGDLTTEDFSVAAPLWADTKLALDFFQTHIPFQTMSPNNGLTSVGGDYVLASAGQYYAIYLPNGGTTNITPAAGTYQVKWYDPRNGGALQDGTVTQVTGGGSASIGNAPSQTSSDWAVVLTELGMLDAVDPDPITDLAASNPTDGSVDLTWTATGDDGATGTATSYDIRYSTSTITEGNWNSATQVAGEPIPQVAGSPESMTVTGLSENTTYYFAVKAIDDAANSSSLSNVPNATTLDDTTAPEAVTDLAAGNPTTTSLDLTWTAPGDDGATGTATSYDVRYSTSTITEGNWASATPATGEPTPSVAGSAESMTVTGLSVDTTYFFAVKATDNGNNTAAISNVASGDTAAQPPGTLVDFETPGDENLFVNMLRDPAINRVAGHGGFILDVFKSNNNTSVKYSPSGDYMLSDGTVSVDAEMQYYNTSGNGATLILKEWTDGLAQHGGYVVTLKPNAGDIKLWIGASKGPDSGTENFEFYRGGATEHTDFFTTTVSTYTGIEDSTIRSIGWWKIEAEMTFVGGDVQIDVTLTDHLAGQHSYSWTDSMAEAQAVPGQVGVGTTGIWSMHGHFDNFSVAPAGAVLPTVTLTASDPSAAEAGPDAGQFTVTRDDTSGNLVVNYTVSGTAGGGDYSETLTGSVTILDGQASATIDITPVDDADIESDETVTLTLVADPAYTVGAQSSDTVTIASDDVPTVTIAATDAAADEVGPDAGSFTVTRAGTGDLTTGNLLVNYTIGGDASAGDYSETLSGTVTILDGNTSAVITITPVDDSEIENAETVTLTLAAGTGYTVGGADNDTVTIADDDVPEVTISATDANASETGPDAGTLTITRSGTGLVTDGDLTVSYTVSGTAGGGDYSETLSGSAVIPDGQTSADITITPVDDAEVESAETVTLTLSGDAAYKVGSPSSDTVTIADNDVVLPVVNITATDAAADEQGQEIGEFTVTRDQTAGNLVVNYAVSGTAVAGDYVETLSGSVTILDGNTSATITITPVDDAEVESAETVTLTLSADAAYTLGGSTSDTVTIADNDQPVVGETVDFETAGDEDLFVNMLNNPAITRVIGHGGYVLDIFKSNKNTSVKYSPSGDYMLSEGTVSTDAELRYYNSTGGGVTLILKEWTDGLAQHGGYVVTLKPDSGDIKLWIGASKGPDAGTMNYEFHRGGATEHTDFFTTTVSTYTGIEDSTIRSIGWWNIEAEMTYVNGGTDVQIDVTLTDHLAGQHNYSWTDSMAEAQTVPGQIGVSSTGAWNMHGHFDNFTVTPAGALPTVTITANDAAAAEAGPDAGQFTVTRDDTAGDLTVNYSVSGSASAGDYSETLSGSVTILDGNSSATIDITPVDDSDIEAAETVTLTILADAAYTVGGASADTVTITSDDVPTVTIAATDGSATEGADAGAFTVTRAGTGDLTTGNLVVNYIVGGTAAAGDVSETLSGTVTILDGNASAVVTITAVDDSEIENAETVVLTLAGGAGYTVGGASSDTVTINDDDVPSVTIAAIDGSADETGPDAGLLRVTRSGTGLVTQGNLVVNYTVSGSAVAGDYSETLSGSVTILDGQASADITITPVDDSEIENAEDVVLTLAGGSGYTIGGANSDSVTIADDDVPTVDITATDASATEGADAGQFTVTRSGTGLVTAGDLTVNYTVSGTASAGDYSETLSGSVTIPNGQASATIDITPVDDADIEADETVTLTLVADPAYTIGVQSSDTVTIVSDDVPTVTIAATDAAADEVGPDAGSFTVTRAGAGDLTDGDLVVNYNLSGTASAGDYSETLSGTVTILDGNTTAVITITPVDDSDVENAETVILTLAAGAGYTVGGADSDTVTIASDDVPEVTISATDASASETGPDAGTLTITRSGSGPAVTDGNLTVNYTVSGSAVAGDYSETLSGSAVIPDGQASVNVTITPVDDGDVEGDETVTLTLAAGAGYTVGGPSSDTVTIADNDVPSVTLTANDASAAESPTDAGQFTVSRDDSTGALTVYYSVSGSASVGDYSETLSGSAVIPDGQLSATIDVTPVDDADVENDETVALTLTADPAYSVGAPSSDTVTIVSEDVPSVTITATDASASEEGPDAGTLTITRAGSGPAVTDGNLTVNYTVGGSAVAGDYSETLSGSVVIPDGQASVNITVTPVDDAEQESTEDVSVTLAAGSGYTVGVPSAAAVNIADNDAPVTQEIVDFETAGDENLFAIMVRDPAISRVSGHGGSVLDLLKSNNAGSVKYSPDGDYMLTMGTLSADIHLQYYNSIGSSQSLILKEWTDGLAQHGGYVVTLQPDGGNVKIMIGASEDPGAHPGGFTFYGSADGHSDRLSTTVTTYTAIEDSTIRSIGWWNVEAEMSVVNGDDVQIDVTITDPDTNTYQHTWTDSLAQAQTGAGQVGLSVNSIWSIHGQYDNFTVTPEGSPVTPEATIAANDASASETGPDAGQFTVTLDSAAVGDVDVNYTVTGTAGTGDYAETLSGVVTVLDGQTSAVIDITPVDDSEIENAETVILTLTAGTGYTVGAADSDTVTIADDDVPVVTISATDASAAEAGPDAGTLTITRSGSGPAVTDGDLTVSYTVGGSASAGDYSETLSGSAVIPDGLASVDVTITPVDDPDVEGDETVTLTVAAGSGYTVGAADSDTVTIADNDSAAGVLFDHGVVAGVDNTGWTTVNLTNTYTSMVVVATPVYGDSSIPLVTRIRNAGGSSFQLRVDRTDGLTTAVTPISIHYFVIEEGAYTLAGDGVKLEAVKYTSTVTDENNSWDGESRTYANSYTTPVVIGQVMTYNDPDWSVFWARGGSRTSPPSASELWVGKHVGEDGDTTRSDETIGYVVLEAGNGMLNDIGFYAAVSSDIVQGASNSPPYTVPVSGLPTVETAVASVAGMDGNNGGWAVLYGPTPLRLTELDMMVDEDQANDAERRHGTEQVSYLVIDPPVEQTVVAAPADEAADTVEEARPAPPAGSWGRKLAARFTRDGLANLPVFAAADGPALPAAAEVMIEALPPATPAADIADSADGDVDLLDLLDLLATPSLDVLN